MPRTGSDRRRPLLALTALLAAGPALLLPSALAAVALLLLLVLWMVDRQSRTERTVVGAGFGLAILLLVLAALRLHLPPPDEAARLAGLEATYTRVLTELRGAAETGAALLAERPADGTGRFAAFEQLEALADKQPGTTLMLVAASGEAIAWAGPGLLHERGSLPASGFTYRRGHTAVTLLAVAPVAGEGLLPERVLAGRSFPTDATPFADASAAGRGAPRWSLADHGDQGAWVIQAADSDWPAPVLVLSEPPPLPLHRAGLLHRLAALAVAATLAALAAWRGLRSIIGPRPPAGAIMVPALLAVPLAALALGLARPVVIAVIIAALLAMVGCGAARWRVTALIRAASGAAAFTALVAAAWLLASWQGAVDLAAGFGGEPDVLALRLAFCIAAVGLLGLAVGQGSTPRPAGTSAAWLVFLLLLAAAALHDHPLPAILLLAMAGAGAALRQSALAVRRGATQLGITLLIAALGAATAWEIAYRAAFRVSLAHDYLPALAPPDSEEKGAFYRDFYAYFEDFDIETLTPPGRGPVDAADLAFSLWRGSPLAYLDGLSALAVRPYGADPSTFAFGMAFDRETDDVLMTSERWNLPPVAAWTHDALVLGEAELRYGDEPYGVASYSFAPRPGFRLGLSELKELENALLRGRRQHVVDGLPRSALYALYTPRGRALVSPWEEAPPLAPAVAGSGVVSTPAGRCWYWAVEEEDGIEVIYLPLLQPLAALQRVAVHALGALLLTALGALLALAFARPRAALAQLAVGALRSYSRRLLIVYAMLLVVPILILDSVLLSAFAQRLRREQQANGEVAINASRHYLFSYLSELEPGIILETRLTTALLDWVSTLVDHQVTLYWRSQLIASSQQELFTAGLLPRRIPGEIFSRLALLGEDLGARLQESGGATYVELYAPLLLGRGTASTEPSLFLSVPLLAQEEEVARELADMRRQTIVVTVGLCLLLAAVGSRLAHSFTTPLMEVVAGTRRIAAGAASLELAPRENELSALVRAIDDMAGRLAEGRRKLLREKQVVERMVGNITSGVVSLDRQRRVLLHNRVAAELLHTEVGEVIDDLLAPMEALRPVYNFLQEVEEGQRHAATLRLVGDDNEERQWTLIWVPLPGSDAPAALLVVDDATEVLRGQRLEAWAEMARIIAHEIKNPLTPIRLSAEHLQQVYREATQHPDSFDRQRLDAVVERCTANILKQVEELRIIASEFSTYSHIPRAEPKEDDLVAALAELRDTYRDAAQRGVALAWHCEEEEILARFDRKLIGRAVRNLLENALRASGGRGEIELGVACQDGAAVIRVADSGPGVAPQHLSRIFEPYFSTHDTGTGLGLPIVRRIVEEHGGTVNAVNRPGGGLEVAITMPLSTEPA